MRNKTGRHNKNYQKRMFTKADWPGFRRVLIGEGLAHVRSLLSLLAPCEFLLQDFFAVTLFSRFSEFRNLQNSDWNLITIFGTLIRYNEEKTGLYFWCNFYTFFPPVKYYKPTHRPTVGIAGGHFVLSKKVCQYQGNAGARLVILRVKLI